MRYTLADYTLPA